MSSSGIVDDDSVAAPNVLDHIASERDEGVRSHMALDTAAVVFVDDDEAAFAVDFGVVASRDGKMFTDGRHRLPEHELGVESRAHTVAKLGKKALFVKLTLLSVDIGTGSKPLNDLAVIVLHRLATRQKPAELAAGGLDAKLDLEGFAGSMRHIPGRLHDAAVLIRHGGVPGALQDLRKGESREITPASVGVFQSAVGRGDPDELRKRLRQETKSGIRCRGGLCAGIFPGDLRHRAVVVMTALDDADDRRRLRGAERTRTPAGRPVRDRPARSVKPAQESSP